MSQALIVYASLTGNTEELAEIAASFLKEAGVEVTVVESVQADPMDFQDYDYCLVGSYTYGVDGDLPDEILDFYEELEEIELAGKVYGVFGSGDTFYDEFCTAVDDFEQQFDKTGAIKGAPGVKVDLNAEEEDVQAMRVFVSQLIETYNTLAG